MTIRFLFEQSGTFKNIAREDGHEAYDYDIQNNFNQTDYVVDLFEEIEKGYNEEKSIFDDFKGDTVVAFFPCTRFEDQISLWYRGEASSQKNKSELEKLEKNLELHKELSRNYELVTKLAILAYRKNFKLIIENPHGGGHYLNRYWCIKPSIIDRNRSLHGDYYKKPTQYWFINTKPSNNLEFSVMNTKPVPYGEIDGKGTRAEKRSMIHPNYARWLLRSYVYE